MRSLYHGPAKIRLVVVVLLMSALLFGFCTAAEVQVSIAPQNPAFIKYLEQQKVSGSQVSRENTADTSGYALGEVPGPVDLSHTTGQHIASVVSANKADTDNAYPANYDLRTLGMVSPVKDQNPFGTCWAFATYGSLESSMMKTAVGPDRSGGIDAAIATPDFSEKNLANLAGFDFDVPNGGGQEWMSTAYLTRWTGPVDESLDPYPLPGESWSSSSTFTPVNHVQNVSFLPGRASPTDNDNIKYALMNQGAVKVSIYWDDSYYNTNSHAFYNGVEYDTNHAVTIVGWDDTYSRTNFVNQSVPGNGAFIVKNSWGSSWGDNGYFYVSYYDLTVGDRAVVFFAEPATAFNRVYSYDPYGWVTSLQIGSSGNTYGEMANIYRTKSDETLKAVGFYTDDVNTNYVVSIHRSPNSGPLNTTGYERRVSGTLTTPGYHTVTVPDVVLKQGERYSIVVSLSNPTYPFPFAVEYPAEGYSSRASANPGESYLSPTGAIGTWTDLTDSFNENANFCIKGYTYVYVPVPGSVVPGTIINQSATIFIGEGGLNVTHALNQAQGTTIDGIPALTRIGWWASGNPTTVPDYTVDLAARYRAFMVDPDTFVGRTGNWYLLNDGGTSPESQTPVFNVQDPSLDIQIWDFTHAANVSGLSVPQGTRLGFRIDTNMYAATYNTRSPLYPANDGFINISVMDENGVSFGMLLNDSVSAGDLAGPLSLKKNFVNTAPWYWGSSVSSWATGALNSSNQPAYPKGTYTVIAKSALNNMRDNYKNGGADYTGKTVSAARTVTITSGIRTLQGIVFDSVTNHRVAGATVTIAGLSTISNSSGHYNITGIPPGVLNAEFTGSPGSGVAPLNVFFNDLSLENSHTLNATNTGYYNFTNNGIIIEEGQTLLYDIPLTPILAPGSGTYRIVLTWAENPRDLDSHLITPQIDGTPYHIYYANKGSMTSPPYAQLDWDDQYSYGPETITINKTFEGTYNYYVYHYAGDGSISSTSNAEVNVYDQNSLIATYRVPTSGDGRYWQVFNLDGSSGIISSINTISSGPQSPDTRGSDTLVKKATDTASPQFICPPGSRIPELNSISSWNWDFGDGDRTNATHQNPMHTYISSGSYTVSLNVTNPAGFSQLIKPRFINVNGSVSTLAFQPMTASVGTGATTNYTIVLDTAGQGLSGYNITVALGNATVGEIVGVTYPAWASLPVNATLPADSIWIKAGDLTGASGTSNITLCTLTVQGDVAGTTNITITPEKIEDRSGGRYSPITIPAQLLVGLPVRPFPNPSGGYFPLPTAPCPPYDLYYDTDGSGFIGFNDVVVDYNNMEGIEAELYGPVSSYDFDRNGWIGFNDVIRLYQAIDNCPV